MPENYLELTAIGIIFLFCVKEFFIWLKTRNGNSTAGKGNELSGEILNELRLMNSNHLNTLNQSVNEGNGKVIDAINNANLNQTKLLMEVISKLK